MKNIFLVILFLSTFFSCKEKKMPSVVLPNDGEYLSSINFKKNNSNYYLKKHTQLLSEYEYAKSKLWKKYQTKGYSAWMLYSLKKDSVLVSIRNLYPQKYQEWYDFSKKGDYENKALIETTAPEFHSLRIVEKWYYLYEYEYTNGYIHYLDEIKILNNEFFKKQKILDSLEGVSHKSEAFF